MTATIRHSVVSNTGALITDPFNTTVMINGGNDCEVKTLLRTINTNEIGTGAGKTRDSTTPAAGQPQGLLLASVTGSSIQSVVTASVRKTATVGSNNFATFAWATATPHIYNLAFMVIDKVQGNGLIVSSLYLLDQGDNAETQIANGDTVIVMFLTGNIPSAVNGALAV